MNEKPNWAATLTAKTEAKRGILEMYDTAIAGGYDPEEARTLIKGSLMQTAPGVWPLAALWLDRERPESDAGG